MLTIQYLGDSEETINLDIASDKAYNVYLYDNVDIDKPFDAQKRQGYFNLACELKKKYYDSRDKDRQNPNKYFDPNNIFSEQDIIEAYNNQF